LRWRQLLGLGHAGERIAFCDFVLNGAPDLLIASLRIEKSDEARDGTPQFRSQLDGIRPFPSPFIEMKSWEDADRQCVFISELAGITMGSGSPSWINGFEQCDRQGLEITLEKKPPFSVQIRRTDVPGVPLYISFEQQKLVISWRFEDAVHNIARPRPNVEAACIYLKEGPALARETVIDGVSMLWPGESVRVSGETITFTPKEVKSVTVSATIADDARVTDALRETIADVVRPFLEVARAPVVELSGGYDSACVALAATDCRQNLLSYGLIHGATVGRQQRARRRELVELLGLADHEYEADNHLELAALEIPEAQLTPFDDNQRIPCAYGVDSHPAGPADLIMTGVGGDELCMEQTFRRRPWELPGSASSSALTVAAGRADMFLRRGIWSLNPLCAPSVVEFCRAVPKALRRNRFLNVLMLTRAGVSDGFLFPRYQEGYGHAMQREAALYDFDAALNESVVADFGITDFSPLLEQAREASNGGFSYSLIASLFWLLKLEYVLRRYVR
jgi:asparagine synthase (glutamine-hydrolysing)